MILVKLSRLMKNEIMCFSVDSDSSFVPQVFVLLYCVNTLLYGLQDTQHPLQNEGF